MVRKGLEQRPEKPGGKIPPNSYLEAPAAASTLGQVHDASRIQVSHKIAGFQIQR